MDYLTHKKIFLWGCIQSIFFFCISVDNGGPHLDKEFNLRIVAFTFLPSLGHLSPLHAQFFRSCRHTLFFFFFFQSFSRKKNKSSKIWWTVVLTGGCRTGHGLMFYSTPLVAFQGNFPPLSTVCRRCAAGIWLVANHTWRSTAPPSHTCATCKSGSLLSALQHIQENKSHPTSHSLLSFVFSMMIIIIVVIIHTA